MRLTSPSPHATSLRPAHRCQRAHRQQGTPAPARRSQAVKAQQFIWIWPDRQDGQRLPSSVPTIQFSTQAVITPGNDDQQTGEQPLRRQPCLSLGQSARKQGMPQARRLPGWGQPRAQRSSSLLAGASPAPEPAAAATEIGHVPARALSWKPGGAVICLANAGAPQTGTASAGHRRFLQHHPWQSHRRRICRHR